MLAALTELVHRHHAQERGDATTRAGSALHKCRGAIDGCDIPSRVGHPDRDCCRFANDCDTIGGRAQNRNGAHQGPDSVSIVVTQVCATASSNGCALENTSNLRARLIDSQRRGAQSHPYRACVDRCRRDVHPGRVGLPVVAPSTALGWLDVGATSHCLSSNALCSQLIPCWRIGESTSAWEEEHGERCRKPGAIRQCRESP